MHNIVIYDDHTDWFCSYGTEIISVRKELKNKRFDEMFESPARYGYIFMELEDPVEGGADESAIIVCNTEYEYNEAYNRCCDALLNHIKVIDLRGLNVKLYENPHIEYSNGRLN